MVLSELKNSELPRAGLGGIGNVISNSTFSFANRHLPVQFRLPSLCSAGGKQNSGKSTHILYQY